MMLEHKRWAKSYHPTNGLNLSLQSCLKKKAAWITYQLGEEARARFLYLKPRV